MNILILHEDPLVSAGIYHFFGPDFVVKIGAAMPDSYDDTIYICDYAKGLELARRRLFGSAQSLKKIVILTHFRRERDILLALGNGIRAYLLQGCSAEELVNAVRAVSKGLVHIASVMAGKVADGMFRPELTERERQVLGLVAEGGLNKVIASALGIAEDTVKAHLKTILCKLEATSRTHAVVLAARRGIISLESQEFRQ